MRRGMVKAILIAVVLANATLIACGSEDSKPFEGAPSYSVEECKSAGGEVIADPGDGSTSRNGCPFNRKYLGSVRAGLEGGICCES